MRLLAIAFAGLAHHGRITVVALHRLCPNGGPNLVAWQPLSTTRPPIGGPRTTIPRAAACANRPTSRRIQTLLTLSVDPSKDEKYDATLERRGDDDDGTTRTTTTSAGTRKPFNKVNAPTLLRQFTLLTPIWTVLAALVGQRFAETLAPRLGSVALVSRSLFVLMFSMALSTTPAAVARALASPGILALNAVCCFGLMPAVAALVALLLQCNASQTAGTLLLGSVCGGQASNLFSLLAGGDVSLSVVCTLSTTLLGVVVTPLLVQILLGSSVVVNGLAVLASVVSLVLGPLVLGLGLARVAPQFVGKISKLCPLVGIVATLFLVAGGAANSYSIITVGSANGGMGQAVLASILLPVLGGAATLGLCHRFPPSSKRTVVIEVLSKSPTLAYVLALKHFDAAAATVPAAAMVTLADGGALVASIWSLIPQTAYDRAAEKTHDVGTVLSKH